MRARAAAGGGFISARQAGTKVMATTIAKNIPAAVSAPNSRRIGVSLAMSEAKPMTAVPPASAIVGPIETSVSTTASRRSVRPGACS